MESIKSRIRQVLHKQFLECPADDTPFQHALAWDSMEELDLEILLEDEFGVSLSEGEVSGQHTVNDVAKLILGKG